MILILGISSLSYFVWRVETQKIVHMQERSSASSIATNLKIAQENRVKSQSFAKEFQKALDLKNAGSYQAAIKVFDDAYSTAGSVLSQTMALKQMAVCYEKLGKYQLAINFYRATSEVTINEYLREEMINKMGELTQLLRHSE